MKNLSKNIRKFLIFSFILTLSCNKILNNSSQNNIYDLKYVTKKLNFYPNQWSSFRMNKDKLNHISNLIDANNYNSLKNVIVNEEFTYQEIQVVNHLFSCYGCSISDFYNSYLLFPQHILIHCDPQYYYNIAKISSLDTMFYINNSKIFIYSLLKYNASKEKYNGFYSKKYEIYPDYEFMWKDTTIFIRIFDNAFDDLKKKEGNKIIFKKNNSIYEKEDITRIGKEIWDYSLSLPCGKKM